MSTPRLYQVPCPMCSNVKVLSRPYWHYCRHASKRHGKDLFAWQGCKHAALASSSKMRSEPEEWALVQDEWERMAEQLFEEYTADWPKEAKASYRNQLAELCSRQGQQMELGDTP